MKKLWYLFIKFYINTALHFYFGKIIVKHEGNIPEKGPVLMVSNHKNAFIDPILIATNTKRELYFLARASAFKIPIVKRILASVNMMPIYRMLDGKKTLSKNEAIFNNCFKILYREKCLLIFPEGTHDIRRWVRPLSKGFTRIALGVLEQYPGLPLRIVPVGLNYTDASKYAENVSIYFGEPILANDYYDPSDFQQSALALKSVVGEAMKQVTAHIPIENYGEIMEKLQHGDFLRPELINAHIKDLAHYRPKDKKPKVSLIYRILKPIVILNSLIPYLVYKLIEPNIQEVEFISTTKFAVGAVGFPLFYLLQGLLLTHFFDYNIGVLYFLGSFLLAWSTAKVKYGK